MHSNISTKLKIKPKLKIKLTLTFKLALILSLLRLCPQATANELAVPDLNVQAQTQVLEQNNYTNIHENVALSKLQGYINNALTLLDKAKAMQNPNTRYKFNYPLLRQDITEIANSINRYINLDKNSQTPRAVPPLHKRY